MTVKKFDIICAGLIVVDVIKEIDEYPKEGNLVHVKKITRSTGGAVPNDLLDLARMDRSLRLAAIGRVGNDEYGDYVITELEKENIDVSGIMRTETHGTAFTDVFNISGGERTFFYYTGANDELKFEDFNFEPNDGTIFHLAYAMSLNALDELGSEYGTYMAKTLAHAKKAGYKTSIDIVTDVGERFKKVVPHSLRYTDYFIVNEIEASLAADIPVREEDGKLSVSSVRKCCEKLFELGVGELVVIHAPEAGFAMDKSGKFYAVPSYVLPEGFIKGKTGAGDAYCCGVLYGIVKNMDIESSLELGTSAACMCMTGLGASDSMCEVEKIKELTKDFKKRELDMNS
ncbi:MAG: carbohydrate kinase family protein [Ruminococcaceae bacterium]|nr:carbohydrate kinase family protein [Oscillospiraceae bacterium]